MSLMKFDSSRWIQYEDWRYLRQGEKDWISKEEVKDFVDELIKKEAEFFGIEVFDFEQLFWTVNQEFILKLTEIFCGSDKVYVPQNDELRQLEQMLFVPVHEKK